MKPQSGKSTIGAPTILVGLAGSLACLIVIAVTATYFYRKKAPNKQHVQQVRGKKYNMSCL